VTVAEPLAGVTAPQRSFLSGTFAELCRIESPSGRERGCAERVVAELRGLGVSVEEDDAGELVGGDCGNLLARVAAGPGREARRGGAAPAAPTSERRSLMFCAHLDTAPPQAAIEPVLCEGVWMNANEGLLGADNKAAVVVLLALARHVHRAGAPLDIELLFTVGGERSLAGARAFEASRLQSPLGFVFDHAAPIGEVVTAAPAQFRFEAGFRGAGAHAGARPAEGRSAILAAARAIASMPARCSAERSSVNVGLLRGGSAINVVPERCSFSGEVCSLEEQDGEALVAEIVQCCYEAANLPDCDVDVDVCSEKAFAAYKHAGSSRALALAERALRRAGLEPRRVSSGAGSDANALLAAGVPCVNLANGSQRPHEPGERVSEAALEEMLCVALALLDEAALELSPPR
jgi:tripeptide aminopeptidase